MKTFRRSAVGCLAAILAVVGTTSVAFAADLTVYGVLRATGEIWEIQPSDGSATLVFTAPIPPSRSYSPGSPNGLAYDTDNNRLYYTEYIGSGDIEAALYFYDGVGQTYAGQVTGAVACADFYGDKYYYIAGNPTDDLYEVTFNPDGTVASNVKIDDITGNARAWTFGGDIAISPEGKLYGFGNRGGTFEFFSVDLDGSNFELIESAYSFALQLAFTADGTLYGHNSSGSGLFYTVDLATGVATEVAGSGAGRLYTDLSSGPRAEPSVEIEKLTNGQDADVPPGPNIVIGQQVVWRYEVTNTGDSDLTIVSVTDDQGVIPVYVSGDDGDGLLNPDETWVYESTGTAVAGQYANVGSVVANFGTIVVEDDDPSHYYGVAAPAPTRMAVGGEAYLVNKVGVVGPWLVLAAVLGAGGWVFSRRRAQG